MIPLSQNVDRFFKESWIYLAYLFLYGLLLTVLYGKMGSFGCFDDCSSYMAGWFLLKGKVLYEQIFFNHQPLAAYISAVVQLLGNPESIYQLVLFHRLFVYVFAIVFGLLLLRKFKTRALLFLLMYESTKYYFFGDRFLAEGLIVYPLAYLLGLVLTGLHKKTLSLLDLFVGTFSVWFVIWMREPYVPLALFLYMGFLFFLKTNKLRIISVSILGLASGALFLLFPFYDYYFSVITVNTSFHLQQPLTFEELLKSFFYPVAIFFYGRETPLRLYEMVLSGVFLSLFFFTTRQKGTVKMLIIIFLSLGLANLRPTVPGMEYYEAFHMLSWYSLFLFSLCFLLFQVRQYKFPLVFRGLVVVIFVSLLVFLFSPSSYIREKTDSQRLFYEGYNQYYTAGEVVRRLSTPDQTLFLDGWNDLIYWQADRTSPYKYSWYTSIMSGFPRYTLAREELLEKTPPDFFYGACNEWPFSHVSKNFLSRYDRFSFSGKPTCLYIKTSNVSSLTSSKKEAVKSFGYGLKGW